MALVVETRTKLTTGSWTDRSDQVEKRSVRVVMRADGQVGTASFSLKGTPPGIEDHCRITLDGTIIHQGWIKNRSRSVINGNSLLPIASVSSVDGNFMLDRAVQHAYNSVVSGTHDDGIITITLLGLLSGTYEGTHAQGGAGTVSSDPYVRGIEGHTGETRQLDAISYPSGAGFDFTSFYGSTPRAVIEKLAKDALLWDDGAGGFHSPVWYVGTSDFRLHWAWSEADVMTAAFDLSDDPDGSTTFGYWDLAITEDSNGLITRWWITDGTHTNPPGTHYPAIYDAVGAWGLYEVAGPANPPAGIPEAQDDHVIRPVTSISLKTHQAIFAGQYVHVFNFGLGDATTHEIVDYDGAVLGLLRAPAVEISFDSKLRPVYGVTLGVAAAPLAGFRR
jgi:hypothetical protein